MRRLEELTNATNMAYRDYQLAKEQRIQAERSRHSGTEELHKALGELRLCARSIRTVLTRKWMLYNCSDLDGLFRVSHRN